MSAGAQPIQTPKQVTALSPGMVSQSSCKGVDLAWPTSILLGQPLCSTERRRRPANMRTSPLGPGTETDVACGRCSSSGGHGRLSSSFCRSRTKRTPSRGSWKLHRQAPFSFSPTYLRMLPKSPGQDAAVQDAVTTGHISSLKCSKTCPTW